jgi:FtsH-binding integral membrane protein
MLRKILGYAVLAVVAFIVLRLALWVIRVTLGLAWTVLMLALVGLVIYWVIKLISPSTARRVKDVISGEHRSEGDL